MAGRKRIRNPASKDMILAAAERVVAKRGPANLTLDAVANEAGLSKGGLLYNFPSKQALIEGMIQGVCERHRQLYERLRDAEGGRPNAGIRSVLASKKELPVDRGTGLAVFAGLAENPELLAPVRGELEVALDDVCQSSRDPMTATLVWLASEGLAFWDLLGISPFDEAGRAKVEAYMSRLVAEDTEAGAPAAATLANQH